LSATDDQIGTIAYWVEGAHDNYRQATGHDTIPNPISLELEKVNRELELERNKVSCSVCKGKGYLVDDYGFRSSESSCFNCRGEGKISP